MIKIGMTFNGRKVTSADQIKRELAKALEGHVTSSLRKAAGPNVRVKKTAHGFAAEGSSDDIEKLKRKLR